MSRHQPPPVPSTSKLNQLFDQYKGMFLSPTLALGCLTWMNFSDPDGENIAVDGTIRLCEDLSVDPEDVVLLAVAYELKSPGMGEWTRKGWVDGWKAIG